MALQYGCMNSDFMLLFLISYSCSCQRPQKEKRSTCYLIAAHPNRSLSFLQIGRSTESPIDFVVTDTVAGSQSNADTQSVQSTISRFACRIICQRTPPYSARIYAAGFDSSKNIFLGVRMVPSHASDMYWH